MLNVVIADDEERICQLIRALVDWESMELQIAGMAHNGMEALQLVETLKPQILITDIRMPGCNGLELIERVKKSAPECEIIIISGYAHFDYAQTAIKFGVGDYLLKPVNQSELYATLRKLKERILERQELESDRQQLLQKSEKDIHRLQMDLMNQLIEQRASALSLKILQEEYYLKAEAGSFQAFWIKIDGRIKELSESGLATVVDKVKGLLMSSMGGRCYELVICQKSCACIGIMNYQKQKAEEVRRALRECLNQLEAQKNLYGAITFSGAVGCASDSPEELERSVREAGVIIKERLVKGTGRILDKLPQDNSLQAKRLLDRYMRLITYAVEVLSLEEADNAAAWVLSEVEQVKNVHGFEVLELAADCGRLFLNQMELRDREQANKSFEEECDNCGSVKEVFLKLGELQRRHLGEMIQQRENDTVRPIRQAKQYIQKHFHEQISMEEVSSEVGLSSAYFSVLFKKAEGEGFAKYLINLRIEEAKRLLRESNSSVAEICRSVGYNDLKHFTHTFEKVTGVKPATYRKLYG